MKNILGKKSSYIEFLIIIFPGLILTLIPSIFGFLPIFLANQGRIQISWLVILGVGSVLLDIFKKRISRSFLIFKMLTILVITGFIGVGYVSSYYGGELIARTSSKVECEFNFIYSGDTTLLGGGQIYVSKESYFPGYMRVVPDSGSLRDEFEQCR